MTPLSEGSRLATVKIHFLPSPCNFTTGFLLPPPPPPPPRPRFPDDFLNLVQPHGMTVFSKFIFPPARRRVSVPAILPARVFNQEFSFQRSARFLS